MDQKTDQPQGLDVAETVAIPLAPVTAPPRRNRTLAEVLKTLPIEEQITIERESKLLIAQWIARPRRLRKGRRRKLRGVPSRKRP